MKAKTPECLLITPVEFRRAIGRGTLHSRYREDCDKHRQAALQIRIGPIPLLWARRSQRLRRHSPRRREGRRARRFPVSGELHPSRRRSRLVHLCRKANIRRRSPCLPGECCSKSLHECKERTAGFLTYLRRTYSAPNKIASLSLEMTAWIMPVAFRIASSASASAGA